ncbi:MAG TPA: hypothetical protein VFL86_00035 [Burkholderiaceae bacterium]|nr:hypothetical protein [Burkholderiaceae bacterium]
MNPLLTLLVMLVLVAGVQRLLSRLIRAVLLSYAPLSGDHSDSVVYHRSLLTPGDVDNRVIWALITAGGVFTWLAVRGNARWGWLAVLALLGALAWDLWTWERAAVSVRRVSWRRGWRKSVRRVPVSQVADVVVAEKPLPWLGGTLGHRLGSCHLRLQLYTGDAVRLPRSSALTDATLLEDVANFLRLQMGAADEEKRRNAQERRRRREPGTPLPESEQEELRLRLQQLRQDGGSGSPAGDTPTGPSLPPENWRSDSWPPDSELQPPTRPAETRSGR